MGGLDSPSGVLHDKVDPHNNPNLLDQGDLFGMTYELELDTLRKRLGEVADLHAALHLLEWDQETYMPPKGATARGFQLATLSALAHRLFTDPAMGALLNTLEKAPLSGDAASLVRETQYDYAKATKLPESFVERFAQEQSMASCARSIGF